MSVGALVEQLIDAVGRALLRGFAEQAAVGDEAGDDELRPGFLEGQLAGGRVLDRRRGVELRCGR